MNLKRESKILDASKNDRWRIDVGELVTCSLQFVLQDGTWAAAVLTIERSNDGINFDPLSTAVTVSAEGYLDNPIDVSEIGWLDISVTTVEGGSSSIKCAFCGKGYP